MANNNQNFNQYNTDINSTRNSNQNGLNINQNPYINSGVNQNFIGQNPNNQMQNQSSSFLNGDFIKGALIGAVATYILTNKNAHRQKPVSYKYLSLGFLPLDLAPCTWQVAGLHWANSLCHS